VFGLEQDEYLSTGGILGSCIFFPEVSFPSLSMLFIVGSTKLRRMVRQGSGNSG